MRFCNFQKYLRSGKRIMIVGANFDFEKRQISDWKSKEIKRQSPLLHFTCISPSYPSRTTGTTGTTRGSKKTFLTYVRVFDG